MISVQHYSMLGAILDILDIIEYHDICLICDIFHNIKYPTAVWFFTWEELVWMNFKFDLIYMSHLAL